MVDSEGAAMTDHGNGLSARGETIERKIDDLSGSVDRRFDAVDRRRRFDAVDSVQSGRRTLQHSRARFDAIDVAFEEQRQYTEFAFARLDAKIDDQRAAFSQLAAKVGEHDAAFGRLEAKIDDNQMAWSRVERKLDQFIDRMLGPKS
jgi:septal ring factor EnvC (AmiA/AmiB activator)